MTLFCVGRDILRSLHLFRADQVRRVSMGPTPTTQQTNVGATCVPGYDFFHNEPKFFSTAHVNPVFVCKIDRDLKE